MSDPARDALRALVEFEVPLAAIANYTRANVAAVRSWVAVENIESLAAERLVLIAHALKTLADWRRHVLHDPPPPLPKRAPLGLGFEDLLRRMQARDAARASGEPL